MIPILANTINESTTVPLGIAVSVAAFLVTMAVAGTGAVFKLVFEVKGLRKDFQTFLANGWTIQDQKFWASELGRKNAKLDVPDVEKIGGAPSPADDE